MFLERKSFYLSNIERCSEVLLRRLNGCNLTVPSLWTQMGVQKESYNRPDGCCLTDERLDGIPRRLDGCKGLELHCLEIRTESS
jgi:hypothetical protein